MAEPVLPFARSRGSWQVSAAATAVTLLAAGSLRGVLQGLTWWLLAAFTAAAAVAVAAALRRATLPWPLPTLLGATVAVMVLTAFYGAGTGLLWLIPTPETVPVIETLIRDAVAQAYVDTPPAVVTPGLQLMLSAGIAALALLVDLLAVVARAPVIAGVPLLLLALVPGRALGRTEDLVGLTGTGLAFLLLLWLDRRRNRALVSGRSAASVAAFAIAGSLVLLAVAPGFAVGTARAAALSPVFDGNADPLLRLGDNLRRGADTRVLTYRTAATNPVYLRVLTLDRFEGRTWGPNPPSYQQANTLDAFAAPPGLSPAVRTESVSIEVTDSFPDRRWLPLPYPVQSVSGLGDGWRWQPDDLTAVSGGSALPATSYVIRSTNVLPTAEQLAAASGALPPGFERYLAVPADTPPVIAARAAEVTAGQTTAYGRAVALQAFFRGSSFVYDEKTPLEQGFDGNSMDVIAKFLDVRRGYCVQYASAMAVMARTLGIPARIAVGYLPGELTSTDGAVKTYEVTTWDLHSWPELYFPGVGWTRFEPTQSRGVLPAYSTPAGTSQTPTPSATPSAAPSPSASSAAGKPTVDAGGTSSGGRGIDLRVLVNGSAVLGSLIVLLLSPALVRIGQRGRRLAALAVSPARAESPARAGPAWTELAATAIDLGLADDSVRTPRQLSDRLAATLSLNADSWTALERLRTAVERERFAVVDPHRTPADLTGARAAVGVALAAMRQSVDWRSRLAARLTPRSLFAKLSASRLAFRWSPPGSG